MKLRFTLLLSSLLALPWIAGGQSSSLQDISRAAESLPRATIFTAREIVTLDPDKPKAEAVAVVGDRILAVGTLDELKAAAGEQPYSVDKRFADQVIVPGLIAQHDHPFLTSITMMSEIIAIEDWVLPSGTVPAAKDRDDYLKRLTTAEAKMEDPDEILVTWGFHHYFHGKLTLADLDIISDSRPIIVWHRSCHEFILNTPALKALGIDQAYYDGMSAGAQEQSNFAEGHFWEQGMFGIVPKVIPAIAPPERIRAGFEFLVDYFHTNGVTLACEPGGLLSKKLQDAQNDVLSNRSNPFRYYFIPDGKSLIAAHPDNLIAETEKILDWGEGMTSMVPNQIKLFADGAIYSQAMQVKEPYTDGHEGAWMMDLDVFAKAFRTYWEAGYQIHIHVNGDAGIEMVLNNLEENMRRHPRHDHRTVIIHFAVSTKAQVDRIKRLGAIVSANSYYPIALADKYGEIGLGPERADPMVRTGDLERAGVSYSFHSDMPMAPAQPLFLMHCAVNRITPSGRVAAPEQRASREGAFRAVTLDAAYSLQLEKEVGSIVPGKLANFTVLGKNPITCEATEIKNIEVISTIHEGRIFEVGEKDTRKSAGVRLPDNFNPHATSPSVIARKHDHDHDHDHAGSGCACTVGKQIAEMIFPTTSGQYVPKNHR